MKATRARRFWALIQLNTLCMATMSNCGIAMSAAMSSKLASRKVTLDRPAALASARALATWLGLKSTPKTWAAGLAAAIRLAV
jgi:hypothetical protein